MNNVHQVQRNVDIYQDCLCTYCIIIAVPTIHTGKNLAMTYHNSNRIKHMPTITLKQNGECIIPTKTTGTCDVESTPITCDVESSPITCDVESSPITCNVESSLITCDVESSPITFDVESFPITCNVESSPIMCDVEFSPITCDEESSPITICINNDLLQLVTLDEIIMLGDENDDLILSTSLLGTILVIKTNKYAYVAYLRYVQFWIFKNKYLKSEA